jgi:hypothetical protein
MRVLFTVKDARGVYAYARQALEDGNRVSYLCTQSSDELARNMSKLWHDAETYVNSNQLSIQSAYDFFPNSRRLGIGKKANTPSKVPRTVKNSIVLICPAAVSAYVRSLLYEPRSRSETIGLQTNGIIDFEELVNDRYLGSTLVCCVFDQFVRSLDIVSLLLLMKHHKFVIGSDGQIMPISEDEIIDAVKRSLDFVMGDGSSTLILKTLQFVYHVSENDILHNPSACFGKFEKMLGAQSANKIRSAALREIRKLIVHKAPLGTALQN